MDHRVQRVQTEHKDSRALLERKALRVRLDHRVYKDRRVPMDQASCSTASGKIIPTPRITS